MAKRTASLAKRLFLRTLAALDVGCLEIVCPENTYRFGRADDPLRATIAVHNERFFRRAVFGGDVGIGPAMSARPHVPVARMLPGVHVAATGHAGHRTGRPGSAQASRPVS